MKLIMISNDFYTDILITLRHILNNNFFFFQGYLGFYKGIVASYVGISETVIHFVIYEAVKSWLIKRRVRDSIKNNNPKEENSSSKTSRDFIEFMAAGAFSKTVASCIAYPHGKLIFNNKQINFLRSRIIYKFFFLNYRSYKNTA